MKTVFAKIGLKDDASEAAALERVTILTDLERDVLALTGAASLEAARGVMAAHKASASELVTVKANLEKIEGERRADRLNAMIAQGKAEKKLSPALEQWALTQTPEALEAFLSVAPTITALETRETHEPGAGKGAKITHDGKTWDELEPFEKHNLYTENPALYAALRDDRPKDPSN